MEPPVRRYLCARCSILVLICSRCDRGNRYCKDCASTQRARCVRAAGKRYQSSQRGRHAHARRQQRWRAKHKKVTHQGSPPPTAFALLSADVSAIKVDVPQRLWQCHFCQGSCAEFVRIDFLRRRIRRSTPHKEAHHARDP